MNCVYLSITNTCSLNFRKEQNSTHYPYLLYSTTPYHRPPQSYVGNFTITFIPTVLLLDSDEHQMWPERRWSPMMAMPVSQGREERAQPACIYAYVLSSTCCRGKKALRRPWYQDLRLLSPQKNKPKLLLRITQPVIILLQYRKETKTPSPKLLPLYNTPVPSCQWLHFCGFITHSCELNSQVENSPNKQFLSFKLHSSEQ